MAKNGSEFPQLFVTDLDGTALGGGYRPYARFPDHYSEFLDRLHARGCQWAINTTWDVQGQWGLVQVSSVRSRPAYFMAELGMRIATLKGDELEFVQPYTADMEARSDAINREHLVPAMLDICNRFPPATVGFYGHLCEMKPRKGLGDEVAAYLSEAYGNHPVLAVGGGPGGIGITPRMLNKSLHTKEVLRLSGISPDRVVVAGDSPGDLPMMTPDLCAHVVCPGDAQPQMKAHVQARDGAIGKAPCGMGVIQAFEELACRHGWEF
jgi:hydroxymethylpyrimidine pyrophosphatase-like HAD family hydrolase